MQPTPSIFFKVFLELGIKSMVSYLVFDAKTISCLLDNPENYKYFTSKFPVFYKNENGSTALDIALEHNQIRSVQLMINYIIHFQNSHVFSHLFQNNIIDLL
jgi:ankyrin repeat protein